MPKPEVEFTSSDAVEYAACAPSIDGLSEAILARSTSSDAVTRILKFEPGTDTSPNGPLAHDFWEEVFIFEGTLTDLRLGETFSAPCWATRPPGMVHGPWRSETGAKMFEVRYYLSEEAP